MFDQLEEPTNHHHHYHHNHHQNPSRHEHHLNKSLTKILNFKRDILMTTQSSISVDYSSTLSPFPPPSPPPAAPPPFDKLPTHYPYRDLMPSVGLTESTAFSSPYSVPISSMHSVDHYANAVVNFSSQAFVSSGSRIIDGSTNSPVTSISPTISTLSTGLVIETRNTTYQELELLSANWQVIIVILYSLTAALALIGNVISIWVLMSGKRSSKELRLFLVNLSLSDILMALFSIPFTYTDFMLGRWIFTPFFCPIVQLMQMTSTFVSIYTLTVIGIDRYIAIIYPLVSGRYNRSSLGTATLLFIWICGFTLGLVQWANTRAAPFRMNDEFKGMQIEYECKETWTQEQKRSLSISLFLITFALPMSILSFTYGSVGLKMFRHSTPGNADVARDKAQHSSKIKIIKMLATIVILFAICWLPWHILTLFLYFGRNFMITLYNSNVGLYVTITLTAHWFSMANSFVNPIIYCFMSENFRADLRLLLRKCLRRSPFFICGASQNRANSQYLNTNTYRSSAYEMSIKSNHISTNNNNHNNLIDNRRKSCVPRLSDKSFAVGAPHYQPATTAYDLNNHHHHHNNNNNNQRLSKRLKFAAAIDSRANSPLPSLLNNKSTTTALLDKESDSSCSSSLILLKSRTNQQHQSLQLLALGNSLDNTKSSPQFGPISARPFVNETSGCGVKYSTATEETLATLLDLDAASNASIKRASITTIETAVAADTTPTVPGVSPETAPNVLELAAKTRTTSESADIATSAHCPNTNSNRNTTTNNTNNNDPHHFPHQKLRLVSSAPNSMKTSVRQNTSPSSSCLSLSEKQSCLRNTHKSPTSDSDSSIAESCALLHLSNNANCDATRNADQDNESVPNSDSSLKVSQFLLTQLSTRVSHQV